MEHWSPIIQTMLWVGLIATALWRFQSFIDEILRALQERIRKGDPVKAWGVELGATPLTSAEQAEKIERDVKELIVSSTETGTDAVENSQPIESKQPTEAEKSDDPVDLDKVAGQYLLLEDLALRAIQDEYGTPISRQLRIGGVEVDGLFAKTDNFISWR